MLELKHISYRVSTPDGEQDILKDISITIPDEKLVVFTCLLYTSDAADE